MSKVILLSKNKDIRHNLASDIKKRGEFIFETERELEIYDLIKKDNDFYTVCIKEVATDTVGVDKVDFEIESDETIESEFTCPYCKSIDYDAFEKSEGETYCGNCGSTVELHYCCGNYNVKPIFPTSIIVIK
ncbi:hypothetical protein G8S49_11295 [Clostridium botulinum C]|uniref:TFIIB-type domain-containing protein n=2 Tax=Clostridium botulinum TaxID=1491 RepID=A0A9Q4TGI8_CLOBO|nr:hypothetical protein [Clostridium botulinum]EGO86223.1 hypothetical protein CBCST_22945 [Clostridium botulinum C str. Stockholm]MCD3195738.1 hypothetical protein [Clostridium botulinum C]MCD3201154.1 hypothetical protein [Clostridium botulinum C]MCD3207118.1 hypothetical protein [Clostridium botulinum C]MCD3209697.1 hypothetical protein [Clostridium botulinum C]